MQRLSNHISGLGQTRFEASALYEPLRKSLLKSNLSQSNISSRSCISASKVVDLTSSRLSRRIKLLSPQQAQHIRNNVYIPLNKRLHPTHNLQLVRNKRFQAIDVEQKYYKPITQDRFNAINRFNYERVEEIVYQTQDQMVTRRNATSGVDQFESYNKFTAFQYDRRPQLKCDNIYTTRNFMQDRTVTYASRQQFQRQSYVISRLGGHVQNGVLLSSLVSPVMQNLSAPLNHMNSTGQFNNTATSFQQRLSAHQDQARNPATRFLNAKLINSNQNQFKINSESVANTTTTTNILHNSQSIPQRQLPHPITQHTISSRTSSELDKITSQVSRGYDFSKISQHQTKSKSQTNTSEYQGKKKQVFKYNLFSFLDQPGNTGCRETGCLRNQIIASKPDLYQWQQ